MKKQKQRVGPLSNLTNARKLICCSGSEYYENVKCFHCSTVSLESKDPYHNNDLLQSKVPAPVPVSVSAPVPVPFPAKTTTKVTVEKVVQDVCLLRESPFRILRVAESGNAKEFHRLLTNDIGKLNVRDSRGRAAVHQATIRNHVSILQVVAAFSGNFDLVDNHDNTPLHLAVEFEALDTLEFLLANSADTKKLNDKYQSALHMACELNKTGALHVLAKYKHALDPDICGEHGRTPLHVAAILDHEECLKILLYEIGACPKKCDLFGNFIIHEAAKHASSRSMEILLTWGDHNGCPRTEMISFFDAEGNVPLHSAVHGGDIKAVELCLRSGAKISTQQHDLSTPVHLACTQGAMDMVKLMFALQPEEKDVCLKSCDMQRMTPLHCAAMFDHHELVEYLISEGASVNVLDKERRSTLIIAASRNGWRTMRVLIRLGANISLKDNDFRNVLHVLVIHGGDLEKIMDVDQHTKDFISILEEKDKHGQTPLHYAAKQGHIKSAGKLLKLGGSIIAKNNEGENVFHIACRFGRLNIIQQILNMELNNSVINEGNGKGLTALHIAAREGHVRVVQALMKKGALLHRAHSGETPLHLAAKNGHTDTMRAILHVHSHLLDQTDKDGNTALHGAAMENRPSAVDFLLRLNCNLTNNMKGYTAIDFALQNKLPSVALVMATHPTRGDEILSMTTGKYASVMLALVARLPQVVTAVLDLGIAKSDNKTDSELYHIKYDFKWLSLMESSDLTEAKLDNKKDEKYLPERKHLPVLNGMVSYGRVELLSHDLSQKYLQMKWNAYGKYIHIAHLFLYLFYLAILTYYTSNICGEPHPHHKEQQQQHHKLEEPVISISNLINNNSSPFQNVSESDYEPIMVTEEPLNFFFPKGQQECAHNLFVLEVFIGLVSIFNIAREFMNTYRQKLKYVLDSSNWTFWAMNIASLLMISYQILPASIIRPSASLVAFLSWFYLLLFLQRFDMVGIYVVMFLEILHTLLRVLMIFSILIVAFGLAFFILLYDGNHVAFEQVPMSLIRTFSMMLGDLDFVNTFVNPFHCDSFPQEEQRALMKECELKRSLPHPIMSFTMISIFMVLMPILLMNLLIGLAVGDIESVRRNAQLKRLAMQVHIHTALEKTLPGFLLSRVDKKEVIEYPNVSKVRLGVIDYLFKYFQPKSTNKRNLCTRRTKSQALDGGVDEEFAANMVSMVQSNKAALGKLSSRLENIETLIRLLCQKMEVCMDMDYTDEGTQMEEAAIFKFDTAEKRSRVSNKKLPRRSDSSVI